MASTPAPFSYAQAAKGESMSRSQSEENRSANKPITGTASDQEMGQVEEEVIPPKASGTVKAAEDVTAEENTTKDEAILNGQYKEHTSDIANPVLIKDERSRATSPSASSNAATTKSIREEDVSATPAESESTWEKISQGSRAEQNTEKTEVNGDDKKLSTFKAIISPMKEAPVPVVNIWRKRLDDAQLKTALKPVLAPAQSEKPMPPPANNSSNRRSVGKGFNATSQSESNVDKTQQRLSRITPAASVPADVLPPPASDATSWPMPGLARFEEKKTSNERSDQPEKISTKSHGKEKWEKVDFVPTAIFNTPLPIRGGARGGRGHGRGGREGLTRGGSVSSPTPPTFDIANNNEGNQSSDRTKPREPSLTRENTSSKAERSSSAGTIGHGEAGSHKQMSNEKRESLGQKAGNVQRSNDARTIPFPTQADNITTSEQSGLSETQKRSSFSHESNVETRLHRGEKRFQQPRTRDAGPEINGYSSSLRERGNRGSWRSKPGTHNFANFGPSMHHQSSFANSKSFSEQRQNSHSATFSAVRESRQGRINTRSHSMSNSQSFGRFGTQNVVANGLPMLQTDMANPAPYMQQPVAMSAIPFQPYVEHIQLPAMLQMQLEYYFSVDNLCKDIFLRKNMNSQGFVHLHVLANFNRIQILTKDELLLKWVCSRSPQLELRTCPDEYDYVRKAEEWENWVLPLEDRDVSAQTDGPTQLFSPRFEALPAIFNGVEMPSYMPHSTPMSPATSFVANGSHGESFSAEPNGQRGHFNQPRFIPTTLSADVPDFKPARSLSNTNPRFQNATEFPTEFLDPALDSLKIFVISTGSDATTVQASESIVATNGDINYPEDKEIAHSAVNTSSTVEHHTNGITQSPKGQRPLDLNLKQSSSERSLSKLSNGMSTDKILNSKPAQKKVTWSSDSIGSEHGEPYKVFRSRALIAREAVAIGDISPAMEDLYLFWSLFLFGKIHSKMYQDFHSTALADANTKQSLVGLKYLLEFYSKFLYSENLMPDRLVQDFVDLATVEYLNQHLPQERPALAQIRKIWNDEAMNSRNRLHLSKKIHEPLKSALDQVSQLP